MKQLRPAEAQEAASDSSDFDLTLDSGEAPAVGTSDDSSSFDLDVSGVGATADSDSEFELTLDDSGNLPGMESVPQVKAADDMESDFEVAALDEAGSEGGGDSTDLESSDFDLALDDSDSSTDGEESRQRGGAARRGCRRGRGVGRRHFRGRRAGRGTG